MNIDEKAKRIKCILSDVDGTLTMGGIDVTDKEKQKCFNIKDLLGAGFLRQTGLKFGIITGDNSEATRRFSKLTGAHFFYQRCVNKGIALHKILETGGLSSKEIAYLGDDLNDIPVFQKVGLRVAVNDGAPELDDFIDLRLKSRGGMGALRELIEIVLKARGMWEYVVKSYQEKNEE